MTDHRSWFPRHVKNFAVAALSYTTAAALIADGYATSQLDWDMISFNGLCVATVITWIYRFEHGRSRADKARNRKTERRLLGAVTEVSDSVADLERKLQLVETDNAYYEITSQLRAMGDEPRWRGHAS